VASCGTHSELTFRDNINTLLQRAARNSLGWRRSELLLICFFLYAGVLVLARPATPGLRYAILAMNAAVGGWLFLLAWAGRIGGGYVQGVVRDWVVFPLAWLAYREMGWLASIDPPAARAMAETWIPLDRLLLEGWGLRRVIENAGAWAPFLLDLAIPLAVVLPIAGLMRLYGGGMRRQVDNFESVYLLAALTCFAMLPHFASMGPGELYPAIATPGASSALVSFNQMLMAEYRNSLAAFPGALIAGAFGAAFGLLRVERGRKVWGWLALTVAALAGVGTTYRRFDYFAGVLMAIVCAAVSLALSWTYRRSPPRA
jgi:hypothetical protein